MDTPLTRDSLRERLRPARGAIVVAIVLLALSGAWLILRARVPTDAAPVLTDPGFRHGLTVDPHARDVPGLRSGDVVVAVGGVTVDDWLSNAVSGRPRISAGSRLVYRIRRDGMERDVPVSLHEGGLSEQGLHDSGGVLLAAIAILVLAGYTTLRRPDRPAARALLVLGAGLVAYCFYNAYAFDTADVVGARTVFWFGLVGSVTTLAIWSAATVHLAFTFPTPVMVLRRRPWLVPAVYGAAIAATGGVHALLLISGRATLARLDTATNLAGAIYTVLALLALGGFVATLVRAWHEPAWREQGALVALGLTITIVVLVTANLVAGSEKWPSWLDALLFLPLPLTIAVAIVRGEFLGIRAVVNRTLVYASLTAVLLALYAAGVELTGTILGNTGLASTFLATGVVAVAFAPVRAAVQRTVDRLLYGQRGHPARVLGALGERLEAAVPPGEVLPAIAETVATTLNLPYVALKTGTADKARVACERGEPVAETHVIPLVHQGRTVGALVVGARRGERAISTHDRTLLADVARQVAAAVSAARLLTDLAASRRRLTVAREEERARLRHDLHDRLGPHLVGLSLQLDTLQSQAREPATADAIGAAYVEATRALEEVRRISRGLRPAALDELGLVEAIDAAAARLTVADQDHPWRASVDAAVQLASIPSDVEAAAYQIAIEALSNAHRHSNGQAAHVRVGIDASGGALTIEIIDDGTGIHPDAVMGVGIRSMRERALAVNGRLRIRHGEEGGTVVRATLPLVNESG